MTNNPASSIECFPFLLKGNDVAGILNISRAFAYQLMRQGHLPTVKIGTSVRVRKEDLLTYIEKNINRNTDPIYVPR